MLDISHLIDGNAAVTIAARYADIFDPNSGQVRRRVALATAADLDRAVAAAQAARSSWAT